MTTPHDPHRDDGLSEDERAFERTFAARLSRAGGAREPSAALDAAILAAARVAVDGRTAAPAAATPAAAAAATQPSQPSSDPAAERGTVVALPPRKPRPRWPLGLSLAASLVLAAGIGIKLYDGALHDGALSHDTAASAEAAAESAGAFADDTSETLAEAILIDPPIERTPPPPPPPLEDAAARARQGGAGRSAGLATAPQGVARSAEADAAADSASAAVEPASAPAVPMSAPPPARRPDPVPSATDEADTLDQVIVTGSRADNARNVGAAEHTRTPLSERRREAGETARAAESQREAAKAESLRRQESAERRALAAPPPPPPPAPVAAPAGSAPSASRAGAGSGFVAEPPAGKSVADVEADDRLYDDRPPVSADSPEFRQAWLQRIRKLSADGRRADARASLLEFRRRYPEAAVPDDLRPLLTPEPAPPTP